MRIVFGILSHYRRRRRELVCWIEGGERCKRSGGWLGLRCELGCCGIHIHQGLRGALSIASWNFSDGQNGDHSMSEMYVTHVDLWPPFPKLAKQKSNPSVIYHLSTTALFLINKEDLGARTRHGCYQRW